MPPHGAEIVSFVNIIAAIVAACFVWWGLRSPTRLPWRVAIILAVAWLLLSLRNVGTVVRGALVDPVVLVASSMVLLPSLAQLVVLWGVGVGLTRFERLGRAQYF